MAQAIEQLEPAKKRIEELEAANKALQDEIDRLNESGAVAATTADEKDREIRDLTDKVKDLTRLLQELYDENMKLMAREGEFVDSLKKIESDLGELYVKQEIDTNIEVLDSPYVLKGGASLDELLQLSVQIPSGF